MSAHRLKWMANWAVPIYWAEGEVGGEEGEMQVDLKLHWGMYSQFRQSNRRMVFCLDCMNVVVSAKRCHCSRSVGVLALLPATPGSVIVARCLACCKLHYRLMSTSGTTGVYCILAYHWPLCKTPSTGVPSLSCPTNGNGVHTLFCLDIETVARDSVALTVNLETPCRHLH